MVLMALTASNSFKNHSSVYLLEYIKGTDTKRKPLERVDVVSALLTWLRGFNIVRLGDSECRYFTEMSWHCIKPLNFTLHEHLGWKLEHFKFLVLKSESEDEILERILHFFELKGYLLLSKPYSEILPFFARHNKKKNKPIKPTNLPDVWVIRNRWTLHMY